jgi:16S rRNA (cytosine1402-N4)-methyltransferase
MTTTYHEPVLLTESVEALQIRKDGVYVDATFGGGGHSRAILDKLGENGRLIAFDRDEDALKNAPDDKRFILVRHNYRYLKNFLRYHNCFPVDGILADLGISGWQIDEAERGFSIRFDAGLDMRMNRESELTAASVLNTYPEDELVRIFSSYGEVFNAKTLARRISEKRKSNSIQRITEFKEILAPLADRQHESQYYAKVFQALRIEVNDELGSLKDFLAQCQQVLKPGGRLVVIAYHSLEDRLVKNMMTKGKFEGEVETDLFGNRRDNFFRVINKKPVEASSEELQKNPRSRSARLRIAEKI